VLGKIILVLGIIGILLGGGVFLVSVLLPILTDGRTSWEEALLGIIPGDVATKTIRTIHEITRTISCNFVGPGSCYFRGSFTSSNFAQKTRPTALYLAGG
jgi:hypothetical protein